jgi:hypothetical protein
LIKRKNMRAGVAAAVVGVGLGTAGPASAGGVGDLLSPAFGTACANHHTGARASGATTHGTGAVDGNLAGIPLGGALNQCGGADAPAVVEDVAETITVEDIQVGLVNVQDAANGNPIKAINQNQIDPISSETTKVAEFVKLPDNPRTLLR